METNNENMETGDQDFVEIRADEDMNDLDEENTDFAHNGGTAEPVKITESGGPGVEQTQTRLQQADAPNDDLLGLDSDTEMDDSETNEDADEHETELMSMPSLQSVMSNMSQLKQKRRVLVKPIKVQELGHPKVLEIISKVSCEEIKLHFVRPQDKPEEWHGILLMHFGSTKAAQLATENLKLVRDDLNIKANEETAYANRTMEQWVKEEKGPKRWTDTLLWVKNIPEDVTECQLFELFTDAEDAVVHRRAGRQTDSTNTKEAFIVYRDGEAARNAAKIYESNAPVVSGQALKVMKYHTPQDIPPKGLLKLRERRLVLKYMDKLSAVKTELEGGENVIPDWCKLRLDKCKSLVEKDDRARKLAGLSAPSLEEFKTQKGVKFIHGEERKETLERLGVLPSSNTRTKTNSPRKRTYDGGKDNEKPKIKSLLQLNTDNQSRSLQHRDHQTSRSSSKCPSLLGDVPSLLMTSLPHLSSQWTTSHGSQAKSGSNSGIDSLLSINPINPMLTHRGSVNSLLGQQSAVNFNNSLMQQNMSSNFSKGKTPLLGSPYTADAVNPLFKMTGSKVPLLGAEPPKKILRIDATGSFCFDYKDRRPHSVSSSVSRSSKRK